MADLIMFTEGKTEILNNGLPSTCYFGLSTKSVDGTNPYTAGVTLAGSGEISGTGYSRKTEAEPTASSGVATFAAKSWTTGSATDWSSVARSIFLATTNDNTGKIICAWNLQTGGAARDLSQANTTENATPTLTLS